MLKPRDALDLMWLERNVHPQPRRDSWSGLGVERELAPLLFVVEGSDVRLEDEGWPRRTPIDDVCRRIERAVLGLVRYPPQPIRDFLCFLEGNVRRAAFEPHDAVPLQPRLRDCTLESFQALFAKRQMDRLVLA